MGNVRLLTSEIKEARSEGKHNTIFHSQLKHTAITPITWKSVADIRKSRAFNPPPEAKHTTSAYNH